jgi:hypothetical protein
VVNIYKTLSLILLVLNIHHHTGGLERKWFMLRTGLTIHHHTGGLENITKATCVVVNQHQRATNLKNHF